MLTVPCTPDMRHCAASPADNISFIEQLWRQCDLEKIWGVVQQRVYESQVHLIDEQKQRLLSGDTTMTTASLKMQLTSGGIMWATAVIKSFFATYNV